MYFDFEENSGGFLVKIGYVKQKTEDDTKDDTKDDTLDERKRNIIKMISANKHITIDEIADKCSVSTETIKRDIKTLQTNKQLKRIGGRKTGHWQIIERK